MIHSFVATLNWVSKALQAHGNRCAAALMPRRRVPVSQAAALPSGLSEADFAATWTVYALKVPPKLCNNVRIALKSHVLQVPRVQSVTRPPAPLLPPAGSPTPIVLLLLKYFAETIEPVSPGLPVGNADFSLAGARDDAVATLLRDAQLPAKCNAAARDFLRAVKAADVTTAAVSISYANWTADALLRHLLPANITVPTSFETVGHIIHLNLRDEHAPYKKLIGEVLLGKLAPRIRTVVNKLQNLGGPYRTFAMEVLAGEEMLETTVRENGCAFTLDFSKVYWNSRLETEHRRIVDSLEDDDILADAFAGVGPFAVPAARRRKCKAVYANDLNPASVEYLRRNAKYNGVDATLLTASCGCAREFLERLVQKENVPVTKVIMNFPSGAPEFLDMFVGLYRGMEDAKMPMPIVHCYCFVKDAAGAGEARERVRNALFGVGDDGGTRGFDILSDEEIEVRNVRDVAPRKHQVCITFRVPEEIAYLVKGTEEREDIVITPARKKQKTLAIG